MRTPTISRSYTRSVSCAASCRCSSPFPSRERVAFHQRVLDEILNQRVESSRNRRNYRCVKRKMSNFPLRRPAAMPLPRVNIDKAIRIIK